MFRHSTKAYKQAIHRQIQTTMDEIKNLASDLCNFCAEMSTTPFGVKVWASLFPFPQFLVAGYLTAYSREPFAKNPAAWYLTARTLSFLVAGRVFRRSPFTKMVGPIMHTPFLLVVPASIHWLLSSPLQVTPPSHDEFMVCFVIYTTVITSFSLLMDLITAVKWLRGGEPGFIKSVPPHKQVSDVVLVLPSVIMLVVGQFL